MQLYMFLYICLVSRVEASDQFCLWLVSYESSHVFKCIYLVKCKKFTRLIVISRCLYSHGLPKLFLWLVNFWWMQGEITNSTSRLERICHTWLNLDGIFIFQQSKWFFNFSLFGQATVRRTVGQKVGGD